LSSGGSAGDASANGGAGGISNGGAGGISNGGTSGAGGVGGAGGVSNSGGAGGVDGGGGTGGVNCFGPFDTPQHCGSCFIQCTGATPKCEPQNDGYKCVPLCTAPLVDCGGQCV